MAVRREKIILEVEDHATNRFMRSAAAAKILDKALDDVDGTMSKNTTTTRANTKAMGDSSREIDRFSGRVRLLADVAAILGPGFVPIGAVVVPAVTALASQLGFAALAGGSAIVAFQGVGDALKAVNKAALEPTAANLEEARLAMERIGPDAREFVTQIREMIPALQQVRNAGAAGLFPGLTLSLEELEDTLPQVERIVFRISEAVGSLSADAGAALSGREWADFLDFLETEAPSAISIFGRTIGKLTHGLAELWMAFDPLNDDVSMWLLGAADGFDKWAQGLSQTEGFQEFVAYLRENGPRVADALGSIGNALLQIIEAAAPLGGPTLQALTAVADVIAAIADSKAGPAIMATVTALALLNRGMRTFEAVSKTAWAQNIRGAEGLTSKLGAARLGRGAALIGGLGIAASGVADGFNLANTATLALTGSVAGPWGAAVGGAVGLALDFAGAQSDAAIDVDGLTATLDRQTGAITANTKQWAAKQLEEDGLLASAEAMGLNLSTVTDAALGQADAIAAVNTELDRFIDAAYNADQSDANYGKIVKAGADAQDLKDRLGGIRGELATTQEGLRRTAAAGGITTGTLTDGFRQAESAAQDFRDAVERINALLSKRASLRDYEQAIDDFTDKLEEIKHPLKFLSEDRTRINIDLPKGREIQAALDNIAQTALKVAENLKGADRRRYLVQAKADFIAAAREIGLTKEAARQLANQLFEIPARRQIHVYAETETAAQKLYSLNAIKLKDKTLYVHVQRLGGGGDPDFMSGGGFARGGWTGPGGKYEPKGVVHGDEFVFSKEATHGNVAMLDRLHRYLRGYAAGGYVSSRRPTAFATSPMRLDVGDLRVTGVLQSDLGPVRIEGIARAAARQVLDADRDFDELVRGK